MPTIFRNSIAKFQTAAGFLKSLDFLVSIVLVLFTILLITSISRMEYTPYKRGMAGVTITYERCRVSSILEESLKTSPYSDNILVGKQELEVEMLTGKHKGETLAAKNYLTNYNSVVAEKGMKLIVIVDELDSGKFQISVFNYHRANYIYWFAFIFLATMVLVSGKKGLMSCLSLIYTFVCILFIFLPLIMRGYSPVWSAVGMVVLVTTTNMFFLNGVTKKTFCAIIGTASGVILSGIILLAFSKLAHVSGFSLEEAESLLFIRQKAGLGVEYILFAGILIASMGAVMDTALSIVSSINELHENMPDLGAMKLFKAGMNVGRDMIGTMSNTLILAFAGAALSTIIILKFNCIQYNNLVNSNFIAIEIAQALSGSMAVVLTIPLTAAITSRIIKTRGAIRTGDRM